MFKIKDLLGYQDEIIALRRDFHMHPELGFEETRTSEIVAKTLENYGIEVTTGIGKTGVIGVIHGNLKGKVVALRADMDALPMQEENDRIKYKSTIDGKMHSCGHDAHAAMLLGAAKVLSENKDKFNGTVKFIFQPAEEGPAPGGGSFIVDSGALDDADATFALHVGPMNGGELWIHQKEASAASDFFDIKIIGIGGHGAAPHMSVDPIVMSAHVVHAFQSIVSRGIDANESSVVTIGSIHGGTAGNIIPEEVTMSGTVRTFNEEVREFIFKRMDEILAGISTMYGGKFELVRQKAYPALINNTEMVHRVKDIATKVLGEGKVTIQEKPLMGSEDFAYYTQKVPGVLAWLGTSNEEKGIISIPHNPKFDLDEDCLINGTCLHVNFALEILK